MSDIGLEFTNVGDEEVREYAYSLFRHKERPDPVAWAESSIFLSKRMGAEIEGPYSTSVTPYVRDVLRDFADPDVEDIVLCWGSQLAKTTVIMVGVGYLIKWDGAPTIWVMPSRNQARKFSESRWQPFVDSCRDLRELKPENPDHWKLLEQHFKTSTLNFVGSNSPGDLASMPAGIVVGDEVDKFPAPKKKEADALSLADERSKGRRRKKRIKTSTPTHAEGNIWSWYLRGDQRYYHVECPHCQTPQRLVWKGVKWDKAARKEDGTWDLAAVKASAHYECVNQKCRGRITDSHKPALLESGKWIPDNDAPEPGVRSYHLSSLYSMMLTFGELAVKFLQAKRMMGGVQNFTNSWLAEPFEEAGIKKDPDLLFARREGYDPRRELPPGVVLLSAGVDVQENPARLEAEIVGVGHNEETWGIEYRVFLGDPELPQVWLELDAWLLQSWKHPLGPTLTVTACIVDSGYLPERVYDFVQPRLWRRIFASKGSSDSAYGMPLVSRPKKTSVQRVPLFIIGTGTGKEMVYSRLAIEKHGPGFMHYPLTGGYDYEYFQQLTAEKIVTRWRYGQKIRKWEKIRERNEALDVRVLALAAITMLNPNMDAVARQLELPLSTDARPTYDGAHASPPSAADQPPLAPSTEAPPDPAAPPAEQTAPPPIPERIMPPAARPPVQHRRPRKGFVGSWR